MMMRLEDIKRKDLETYIYEGHKDAYGVKGRHYKFDTMSMEKLREEADRIADAIDVALEEEKEAKNQALEEFEKEVETFIASGAGNRKTALRWMLLLSELELDENDPQDIEHWVWKKGILFTDTGRELVKELDHILSQEMWQTVQMNIKLAKESG
tara:strand:- start:239 stop:703 length:465 start_codon:yes stop_codon:yes gene_type:complete